MLKRGAKSPMQIEVTDDTKPPSPQSTPTKKQTSPPKTPPSHGSTFRIAPLQVQIPVDDDVDKASRPPSPSASGTIRPADLVLELHPPSPSSQPSSAASSPRASHRPSSNKQSQMRGLSVMSYRIKQLVSKEKRRFDEDGFNLDLTYVTNRLIAFGYPAENLEGLYRNHYKDVYNFFERRHAGRYKIYNLCAERSYDKDKFHNRVAEYPFYDHCPPPLALFLPFCQDVDAWLSAHPENVAAIHCKAGKGRTGVMICAYMIYARMWKTSFASMEFFGAARSLKREGVTIPSQRRFIHYFSIMCQREDDANDPEAAAELALKADDFCQLWEETIDGRGITSKRQQIPICPTLPVTARLVLMGVKIRGVYGHKRIDPRIRLECGLGKMATVYEPLASFSSSSPPEASRVSVSGSMPTTPTTTTTPGAAKDAPFWSTIEMQLPCDRLLLWDEVRVSLRHRTGAKLGHFWFHTSFVPSLALTVAKEDMDKLHKDARKGHKQVAPDFSVTLVFERATPEDMAGLRAGRRTNSAPDASGSPPASPGRLRAWASLSDKRSDAGLTKAAAVSPVRPRALTDQHAPTSDAVSTPPSPTPASSSCSSSSRSAPSSPKSFSMRFFSPRKRDASVSVAETAE